MATELERTLKRMKVTIKTAALASTPAHGFLPASRPWRVTLTREVKDANPTRLTVLVLSQNEPDVGTVIQQLTANIKDSEMTPWEFAQEYNEGKVDDSVSEMHKSCKRIAARVQRFFGNTLSNVTLKAAA